MKLKQKNLIAILVSLNSFVLGQENQLSNTSSSDFNLSPCQDGEQPLSSSSDFKPSSHQDSKPSSLSSDSNPSHYLGDKQPPSSSSDFKPSSHQDSKPSSLSSDSNPSHYLGDKQLPLNNPNRFLFEASFIYWQAYEDGLEYGLIENSTINNVAAPFVENQIYPGEVINQSYNQSGSFKDKNPEFKWDPGFKVGIGVVFGERDQWDAILNWTWLKSNATGSFTNNQPYVVNIPNGNLYVEGEPALFVKDNSYLIPSWGSYALGGPALGAKAHWLMHYNTIDLEFGRNFFLQNQVTLRPHIGARAASIHQSMKVNYDSIYNSTQWEEDLLVVPSNLIRTSSKNNRFKGKNHFDGVGLRGGLDANWNFLEHFGLYGKISGALLYGRFNLHENFESNLGLFTQGFIGVPTSNAFFFNNVTNYDLTIEDNYHRIRSTCQLALGFTWHRDFNNDKQRLAVSLGYEFNEWFEQNELRELLVPPTPNPIVISTDYLVDPAFPPDIDPLVNAFVGQATNLSDGTRSNQRKGNLGLQGLTFDVRFDF